MVSFCILDNYLSITLVISLNAIVTASIQPELKLINVVFRHGDRTPRSDRDESFPTDPYVNDSFFPTGVGQLTNRGKKREYDLGQALRARYKDFLGDLYLPKLVVGHSSDIDRTKMSLQLVLAALFSPTDHRQRWNTDLNWQPIPTTYISHIDDNFYEGYECPKYFDESDRILNLPEIKKEISRFKDIMSKLTELTGKNIEKPIDVYFLYHTFAAESSMNLTLPEWVHDYFPDGPLFDTTVFAYNINGFTPLIRKLLAGPMIRAILNNMIAGKNPIPSNTKLYLYSGHEANIASILHAFKLYKPHVPEYSSAVILELLEQNKQYYVKFLYYRGIPPIFDELQIPGCEMLCPFDKFSYLIHDLIPSDEDIVCDKRQTPKYANTEYPITLESKTYNLIKKHKFN
ncbi:venom acid phosphatase Acph-1-like [Camponotus floridanus]|uniref:venom acid phosphatase Acph-1-like n=1 Tax=Camponotus floridanus TaxID=104421 RepID=UPI000DC6992D|nr:venom acid phosphatase Acph-1-like [Camponotus floridanus]